MRIMIDILHPAHVHFFRNFIKENAEKDDVRGFVRNLEDGRVEVFLHRPLAGL